jgi:Domain of unknown function (DUF397)
VNSPLPSDPLGWRKSSYSSSTNCVEVAPLPDGNIAIRNSKHPTRGVTVFTRDEIAAFLQGAKAGEFDDMT